MNKIICITLIPCIINSMGFQEEYHEHRSRGLQLYANVTTQTTFEKLIKKTNDHNLKNLFSLIAFTQSIESLFQKKLYEFTRLLEEEYVAKRTAHHFTDLTLARVFLEKKHPHLHIGSNKIGLSNVFTDGQRIENFIFNLNVLQSSPEIYAKLIEKLYQVQQQGTNNRHAELNFAIAVSMASRTIRKKVRLQ